MKMKQKFLAIILMLGAGMFTACTFDDFESEPSNWRPKTETWTVNIEPEYVFGSSSWGGFNVYSLQMEAVNEKGERVATYNPHEINGFTYEEGYRYRLKIDATTTDPMIMDAPNYTFQLKEVLSKEYVGIRTEGRREVTMDVRRVAMSHPNPMSSEGFYYLCGKTIDGSETLDMGNEEILGCQVKMFRETDENHHYQTYKCRMRLSITPSERPVWGSHEYRIRFLELLSMEELPSDSIVTASSAEEFYSKLR